MDIPYIDFPGGPHAVVPYPPPVGAIGEPVFVVGSPDASTLLAVVTNGSWYSLAVSYDYGQTWVDVEGVSLADTEVPVELDVWYDTTLNAFVSKKVIASDSADTAGVGFSGPATSTNGALWTEYVGPAIEAPHIKWVLLADPTYEVIQVSDTQIENPNPDGETGPYYIVTQAVITATQGGYLMTSWNGYSTGLKSGELLLFSGDGESWEPVNLPSTLFGDPDDPDTYNDAFLEPPYGRVARLPNGNYLVRAVHGNGDAWVAEVEFHFGIPVVPPFWTNHVNTVEYI